MKKINIKGKPLVVSAVFLSFAICISCINFALNLWSTSKQRETVITSVNRNYSTEFSSALDLIKNNKPVFFKEIDSELLFFEIPDSLPPVVWTQADYISVANEFMRDIGREPLAENSLIRTLHFSLPCQDISFGMQVVDLRSYIYEITNNQKSRIESGIDIFPKKGLISWYETEYTPNLNSQSTIEFGDINISADQALSIAETNGGQQARKLANNTCDISISLAGGISKSDWLVTYEEDSNTTIFSISIDEKTGKHKINH